jgi:glycosyltransferase involved in cell wall biosynthesis
MKYGNRSLSLSPPNGMSPSPLQLSRPVIGARIGGIPERVIDEETGLLFEMGNVHDLRSKIEHLLNEGDSLRKMGRKARIFVEKEFGAERHYEKLISIYETALQRHRSAAYCS